MTQAGEGSLVDPEATRGCPSDEALAAFAGAEQAHDAAVVEHLDQCDECRRIVSALAEVAHEEASYDRVTHVGDASSGSAVTAGVAAGQTLGRYEIRRVLGHGAMGEVWAAQDSLLDREVAVKVLRLRTKALGTAAASRLKREAQAMARLAHPNVVSIYDLGTAGDQVFCAMELIDGVTLRTWLEVDRSWRDVLEVLLAIGRGLAAAHGAGLVHRDIKPDNVLMTRDGTPKITDFGLAKLLSTTEAVAESSAQGDEPLTGTATEVLTATGGLVGTPAYMPLEQLEGLRVGPQSDQFSFCVTAYEALFGTRPMLGKTFDELLAATKRGASEPSNTRGVPRAAIRCLLRGLARDPNGRYPSMDALLDELSSALPRRRRRIKLALGAGVALALGALAISPYLLRDDPQESVRSAAQDRISSIWNDDVRSDLREHFLSLDSPAAEEAFGNVAEQLDQFRSQWLAGRVDAWAATRVRLEQSPELLELRIACLERLAGAMQSAVRVLATVDSDEIARAPEVAWGLPKVAQCADITRVRQQPRPPSTPEGQAVEADLQALESLFLLGRKDQAQVQAKAAVAAVESSPDKSLLPRAVFNLGWIEADLGHYTEAESHIRRALELGAAAQDHRLVADVWLRLFSLIGLDQRRPDDALALEPAVRAAVLQAGNDPTQRGDLAKSLGLVEVARSDFAAAREYFKESRELHVAAVGPDSYEVALADMNLASTLLHLNELDEAQRRLESAEAIVRATGGALHPTLAHIQQNLCALTFRREDWAASEQHCRAGVEVNQRVLGIDHPVTAKSRLYLGRALIELERLDEAEREIDHAREAFEKTLAAGNPQRIYADVYLARVLAGRNEYLEAEHIARTALAVLRQQQIPEHIQLFVIAELATYVSHRDPAEALDLYDEVLTLHLASEPRDKSSDEEILTELGNAALAAKQPGRALVWFARLPEAAAKIPELRRSLEGQVSRQPAPQKN